MVRLENLHDQADDAAGSEEFAALLPFRARELAEKIFVDPAEGVVLQRLGDFRNFLEQLLEQRAVKNLICARQHAGEMRIVLFDIRYRLVDFLADIFALRQIEQPLVAVGCEIDDALGVISTRFVDARRTEPPARTRFLQFGATLSETRFGEAKKDQSEDWVEYCAAVSPELARS